MRILIGILCLCFLIFFHELGHFLAAKLFKVKVESFSIGFGPKLFHKTIKGTDYRLSLFPIGGYCGIKGEKDFRKALEEKLPEITGEPDSMYGVHPIKRALIGFAGPLFNLIFTIFALTVISLSGYTTMTFSNRIIIASEIDSSYESPAAQAGLQTGDFIISVNEKTTEDFSDLLTQISSRPDEDLSITVKRDEKIMTFKVHSLIDKDSGIGKIGVAADNSTLHEKQIPGKNFFAATIDSFCETFEMANLIFKGFSTLFKGINIQNSVSGPARVADMLGQVAEDSAQSGAKVLFINLLNFLAIISLSLFIMNLLPIPILDGGLILFALIETIIRKKIHPKVYYYVQFVGLFFIGILFIIGISGDFVYFKNLISQGSAQ